MISYIHRTYIHIPTFQLHRLCIEAEEDYPFLHRVTEESGRPSTPTIHHRTPWLTPGETRTELRLQHQHMIRAGFVPLPSFILATLFYLAIFTLIINILTRIF